MKKFDIGYIYYHLLSDFFGSLVFLFIFADEILFGEDVSAKDTMTALPYFVIAFIIIYALFIVYRIIFYKTSGYSLTEKEIMCKQGVLFRKKSVLEYGKIHAINKKQNLIHKLFKIAVLTIDSGSTNTAHIAEIRIIEKEKTVDSLLEELHQLKSDGIRKTSEKTVLLSNSDSLYSFTSKRKVLYCAISMLSIAFSTAILCILLGSVIGTLNYALKLNLFGTLGQYILYSFIILLLAILVLSVFSFIVNIIYSFIGYHNFKITKHDNDIEISFGLLERHTNTFSYDRIKAVKISQGLVQRLLGFATIKLEVIGYVNESGDSNAQLGILVPFCKYSEVPEILQKVLPDYIPLEKKSKSVAYFPFISWFSLILGIVTAIILLTVTINLKIFAVPTFVYGIVLAIILTCAVVIFCISALNSYFSFKNSGIATDTNKITAYSGGFTRVITVFMRKNLIAVEDKTTPLRKKAGITTLVLHLRTNALSNEFEVQMQDLNLVKDLEQMLIL